jgi:hypothetical protein
VKTWYFAKCDKCKEYKDFFCTNPSVTAAYMAHRDEEIQVWFSKHYGCELTMGWRDDHLDAVIEAGYTK